MASHPPSTILLTGATGYIGGRLLRRLEEEGHAVRCLARRPEALHDTVAARTRVVQGDVLDRASLDRAMEGIQVAFYLVHSMGASGSFEEADREAAVHFGQAAKAAGVRRIIYVGGLGRDDEDLSPHLRSRHEVGDLLRESGVGVVEFRASVVIGSGSLSFEMIRALVERLPFMVAPKWVSVKTQPIAIDDLLSYLMEAITLPTERDGTYEVGGADRMSYGELMREYARQRGKRLHILPVPFLTPYLSSLWLGLVTPLYARVGRKLIASLVHSTVVRDDAALEVFSIRPISMHEAVRRALAREDREFAETRWSDALSSSGTPRSYGGVRFGRRLVDSRTLHTSAPPASCFARIQSIGGETGWYRYNWLWQFRGFLDLLVGGPGMRRGRPHPTELRPGDTVDFWRVEEFEAGRRLRLYAEMKLPGRAWLEFEVHPEGEGAMIRQTAIFDPIGWFGRVYWYGVYPLHHLIFGGMLKAIGREAASVEPPGAVRLDGLGKAELLERLRAQGVRLNQAAEDLFADPRFEPSEGAREIGIRALSVKELGFERGAKLPRIMARARASGLEPCPLELAPYLRLQYSGQAPVPVDAPVTKGQAPLGSLTVVSAPLDDEEGTPQGFYLRMVGTAQWLRGYLSGPEHVWSPEDVLVFALETGIARS